MLLAAETALPPSFACGSARCGARLGLLGRCRADDDALDARLARAFVAAPRRCLCRCRLAALLDALRPGLGCRTLSLALAVRDRLARGAPLAPIAGLGSLAASYIGLMLAMRVSGLRELCRLALVI